MCIIISRHHSLAERETRLTKQLCVVTLWKMWPNLTPLVVRVVEVEPGVEVVLEEVQEGEEVEDIQKQVGMEVVNLNTVVEVEVGPH